MIISRVQLLVVDCADVLLTSTRTPTGTEFFLEASHAQLVERLLVVGKRYYDTKTPPPFSICVKEH